MTNDRKKFLDMVREDEISDLVHCGEKIIRYGQEMADYHEDIVHAFEGGIDDVRETTECMGFDFIVPHTSKELSHILEDYICITSECLSALIRLKHRVGFAVGMFDKDNEENYKEIQRAKKLIIENRFKLCLQDNGADEEADNIYDDDYGDVIV